MRRSTRSEFRLRLQTRRFGDAEDILDRTSLALLQVPQSLLDTLQAALDDLLRLRLEPALLESLAQIPRVHIAEILELIVYRADGRSALLDVLRNGTVVPAWKHEGDFRPLWLEDLAQVLETALFGHGVEGVV